MEEYRIPQKQLIQGFLGLCVISFLLYLFEGRELTGILKSLITGVFVILLLYKKPITFETRKFVFYIITGFIGSIVGVYLYLSLFMRFSTAPNPPSRIFLLVFLGSYLGGMLVGKLLTKTDRIKNFLWI